MSNNNLGLYIGIGVASVVALGGGGYYLASSSKPEQPRKSSSSFSDDVYSPRNSFQYDDGNYDGNADASSLFGGKRKRKPTLKKRRGKK